MSTWSTARMSAATSNVGHSSMTRRPDRSPRCSDAEQPRRVVPTDLTEPPVAEVEPDEHVQLMGVGVRDVREVCAEEDLLLQRCEPRRERLTQLTLAPERI